MVVLFVQRRDPDFGKLQQQRVFGKCLLRCIAKIGEQTKVQVFIPIGQEPDLQCLDQFLDGVRTR